MLLIGLFDFVKVAFDSKTHFCSLGKVGCVEPFIYQENFFYTPELSAFNQMKIMKETEDFKWEETKGESNSNTRLGSCF